MNARGGVDKSDHNSSTLRTGITAPWHTHAQYAHSRIPCPVHVRVVYDFAFT